MSASFVQPVQAGEPLPQQTGLETRSRRTAPRHILTVNLEDWFQVGAFHHLIDRSQWYRFEPRLERSLQTTLDLLDQCDTKATFFVLGWVAEQMPELLRRITERGHEIASRGFYHRSIRDLSCGEFRDDLRRSQEAIERAGGQRVAGYRIADGWLEPADLWVLDVLADQGYRYDSSLLPRRSEFSNAEAAKTIHEYRREAGALIEVPPSIGQFLGYEFPLGGNGLRQLPAWLMNRSIQQWQQTGQPLVTYFHVWELDPEQPRVSAAGRVARVRHYRNLDRMRQRVETLLSNHRFGSIAEFLKLPTRPVTSGSPSVTQPTPESEERSGRQPLNPSPVRSTVETVTPVSIVIPCFNEEESLPALARTLERVQFELAPRYAAQFVLVDDRSRDNTWALMQTLFADRSHCTLVRHERNSGVSAAILTGIRHAQTELVCSMDCDCSYDPVELKHMLPLMTDDVDLVTASPYHPQGHVKNVPGWRLILSKTLSRMYRLVLPARLHTWTSCFRVYRKPVVETLPLTESGFLGTAEMVGQLALRGSRIVEHPATLEVRIFGESKMKTCRTIRGHLRLLARLIRQRWMTGRQPPSST